MAEEEEEGPLQEFRNRMSNFAGEMMAFERKMRSMQEEVRGVHDELDFRLTDDLRTMQGEMKAMQEKMKAMQDDVGQRVESEMRSVQHGIKSLHEEMQSKQGEMGHGLSDELSKMHRRLSRLQEDMRSLHHETQTYMKEELRNLQDKMSVLEDELIRTREDDDEDEQPEEAEAGDDDEEDSNLVEEGQVGIGIEEYHLNSGDEMGIHMQTIMIDVQDEIGKKKVELEMMQDRMRALHADVDSNISEEIRQMQGKLGTVQTEVKKMLTEMGKYELVSRREEIKWMCDEMKDFERKSAKLQAEMRDMQDEMGLMESNLEEMLYIIGEIQYKVVNLVYEMRKSAHPASALVDDFAYLDDVSFHGEKECQNAPVGEGKEKTKTEHQYVPDEFVTKKKFSVHNETGSNETIFVRSETAADNEAAAKHDDPNVKGEGVALPNDEVITDPGPEKVEQQPPPQSENAAPEALSGMLGEGELGDSDETLIRVPEESFNASLETIGGVSAGRGSDRPESADEGGTDEPAGSWESSGMTEEDLKAVIHEEIRNIQGEMINLEDDMNSMHQDVKQMQEDVRSMQGEVENVRDEINIIQEEMATLLDRIGLKGHGTVSINPVTSSSNSDASNSVDDSSLGFSNGDFH